MALTPPALPTPLQISRFGTLTSLGATEAGFAALIEGRSGFGPGPDWVPREQPVACVRSPVGDGARTVALALAALGGLDVDPRGLAVIVATTTSDMLAGELAIEAWVKGGKPARPVDYMWSHLAHWPAVAVADHLGATGPALVVSTACTSGTVAIGVAADLVRAGRCERALVVGADALCRTTIHGFRSLSAYSTTRCRPMDKARDGMAIGEAAAWLLLEPRTASPTPGGARFSLIGVATATDAYHLTAPEPRGSGVLRAIAGATRGLDPAHIDHVNAHATGTEANDAAEAAALSRAAPRAAISATKGASGHTLGAAGVLEAVWLLQAMEAGVIPPVVGLEDPVDGVDVAGVVRSREQTVGVSVNLAFGGHNAAVAFRKEAR
ncbi:MAG: beta-ketoacyl synthase N-terminal-like domain-containing protein [Pseudomonadota bacterium]|nr:beta-ketoacyl synthase N-terminal-like domain-containing protein [Pseudomonadota bacterium]